MKIAQTNRPVLVATHNISSSPREPKSALRGRIQRLGLAFLACTLVIGATSSASAGQTQDEAAIRALVDALLTLHNVSGPDGTVIPVIPVNFFYVASRHGGQWLIEDGRAHFAPAPVNSMTSRK
jgi:hypothetical protein